MYNDLIYCIVPYIDDFSVIKVFENMYDESQKRCLYNCTIYAEFKISNRDDLETACKFKKLLNVNMNLPNICEDYFKLIQNVEILVLQNIETFCTANVLRFDAIYIDTRTIQKVSTFVERNTTDMLEESPIRYLQKLKVLDIHNTAMRHKDYHEINKLPNLHTLIVDKIAQSHYFADMDVKLIVKEKIMDIELFTRTYNMMFKMSSGREPLTFSN